MSKNRGGAKLRAGKRDELDAANLAEDDATARADERSDPPARVVIIGRPNVGKSTLFNRMIGHRKALVHDEPGVTRDRNEGKATWWIGARPYPVHLTDTGGLGGDRFADEIERQVTVALEEAEVVVLLFDGQAGLTTLDEELVLRLKRSGISKRAPVIGVVNKVDAESHEERVSEFFGAGLDTVLTISAEHGRGIDDLQEAIAEALPREGRTTSERDENPMPRIAIIGRPNVGKSTLLNALIGEERMITSPIAGTTIDAVDSLVELEGRQYVFVDTAGIRRKSKTEQGVEVLSVVQARKALDRADITILMLDGEGGITDQDEKIGSIIEEVGTSVILVMNKWDLQAKNQKFTKEMAAERIRKTMAYLRYAPVVFVSAKKKQGLHELPDLIDEILEQRKVKVQTKEFSDWIRDESRVHNPFNAKFFLCHQAGRHPPTFVCHVNDPERVDFSLRRHLVNALRAKWGFMGSPIRMIFVGGKGKEAKPRNRRPAPPTR